MASEWKRSCRCKTCRTKISCKNEWIDFFYVCVCMYFIGAIAIIAALRKFMHFDISVQQDCRMERIFINLTYRTEGPYTNLDLTFDLNWFSYDETQHLKIFTFRTASKCKGLVMNYWKKIRGFFIKFYVNVYQRHR